MPSTGAGAIHPICYLRYETRSCQSALGQRQSFRFLQICRQLALADFYRQYGAHKFPSAARPIHDACVTGYLLAPQIYEQRSCSVTVDIVSPETIGMTVVDWWHVTGRRKNCNVLRRIEPQPFFDLMLERISSLP